MSDERLTLSDLVDYIEGHPMTLTDFLLARIAELQDEAMAHPDPAWVLAECEAKRKIVKRHVELGQMERTYWLDCLALPYADHPDYREEWKP